MRLLKMTRVIQRSSATLSMVHRSAPPPSFASHRVIVVVYGREALTLRRDETPILQNDLKIFGDTVIVPNWQPGTVTAWRVVRSDRVD